MLYETQISPNSLFWYRSQSMQKSKDFFYNFNAILNLMDSDALKRTRALHFFFKYEDIIF